MTMLDRARAWARAIRRDVIVLWLAARHPATPRFVRVAAAAVAAYALSPIDLIPDFVPVLGYLDDVIIVPLGILLVARLVPADLLSELRAVAASRPVHATSWVGAAVVIGIWTAGAAGLAWAFWAAPR